MGFRVLDVCFPHCPLSPCSRETDKSSVPHLEDFTIKGRGEEVAEKPYSQHTETLWASVCFLVLPEPGSWGL